MGLASLATPLSTVSATPRFSPSEVRPVPPSALVAKGSALASGAATDETRSAPRKAPFLRFPSMEPSSVLCTAVSVVPFPASAMVPSKMPAKALPLPPKVSAWARSRLFTPSFRSQGLSTGPSRTLVPSSRTWPPAASMARRSTLNRSSCIVASSATFRHGTLWKTSEATSAWIFPRIPSKRCGSAGGGAVSVSSKSASASSFAARASSAKVVVARLPSPCISTEAVPLTVSSSTRSVHGLTLIVVVPPRLALPLSDRAIGFPGGLSRSSPGRRSAPARSRSTSKR